MIWHNDYVNFQKIRCMWAKKEKKEEKITNKINSTRFFMNKLFHIFLSFRYSIFVLCLFFRWFSAFGSLFSFFNNILFFFLLYVSLLSSYISSNQKIDHFPLLVICHLIYICVVFVSMFFRSVLSLSLLDYRPFMETNIMFFQSILIDAGFPGVCVQCTLLVLFVECIMFPKPLFELKSKQKPMINQWIYTIPYAI